MIIRRYEPDDWEGVKTIFSKAKPFELKGCPGYNGIIPLEQDGFLLELFHKSLIYVGETDGGIVGFGGYMGALITWLFVTPERFRSGIGSQILEKILNEVGGRAWLTVAKTNVAARSLYAKYGFETVEEFSGHYNGCEVQILRMALNPQEFAGSFYVDKNIGL